MAQNGRIPDSALRVIPGGGRLLAAVAITWMAICAEVHRLHGWTPTPTGALDAYRPYDGNYYAQVETFLRRYTRTRLAGRPTKVWNGVTYWLRPGQATAAVPGTSNHGWACAVDVTGLGGFDGTRYRQFAEVAARFGWTNAEGRVIGEPWHWVDVGTAHLVANGLVDLTTPDITIPGITVPAELTEDDMAGEGPTILAVVEELRERVLGLDGTMNKKVDEVKSIAVGLPREVWREPITDPATGEVGVAEDRLAWMDRRVRDLTASAAGHAAALTALAAAQGLDPDAVRAAAEQGARDALADLTLTVKP